MIGRGGRRHAGVQDLLPLEEIAGDVLLLRSGDARAVLAAGCVNFALKSEAEQAAIVAGYRRFLNGLAYPLQLLVRVVPTDVERYLAGLEPGRDASAALRRIGRDHAAFVRRIARERTLLERRCYVVIPAPAAARPRRRFRPRAPEAAPDRLALRRQLAFRAEEVARGLAACGIATHRLAGGELALLWRTALAGEAVAPPPAVGAAPIGSAGVPMGAEAGDA